MSFVIHKHTLRQSLVNEIQGMTPEFSYGEFGKVVFYRTYSRARPDGSMESWNDVVLRVMSGVLSIRKDWYIKNHLRWEPDDWDDYARGMALSLFEFKWVPGGRGLWMMGTDFIYNHGSMALNNCAYSSIGKDIGDICHWVADALMLGTGVGFTPERDDDLEVYEPTGNIQKFIVPDTREGWCDSIKIKIDSWTNKNSSPVLMDYSLVRPEGLPIKGFGGLSSGPAPLQYLHEQIDKFMSMYLHGGDWYDSVMLKADIVNAIGQCVVSGNVRRSAEIAMGSVDDQVFLNLKDYKKYPHRAELGWLSNNTAVFEYDSDFEKLGEIARRVVKNAEPGICNMRNMKHGRVGRNDNVRPDNARGLNPCGEIPLENFELCNLSETAPTKCTTDEEWLKACEYATLYSSTVSLLPTHRPETNAVVSRNRRIGVSIIDWTGWYADKGLHKVIGLMNKGYDKVRQINKWANSEAGVPEAIRVTTLKPGGSVPKIVGKPSGGSYPNFKYQIRRIRVAKNSPIAALMKGANIPHEDDIVSSNTLVFEYPLHVDSKAKVSKDVSLWEQATNLITLQNVWADNSVSNTLNFKPKWSMNRVIESPFNHLDLVDRASAEFKTDLRLFLESLRSEYENAKIKITLDREYGIEKLKVYVYDVRHEEDDLLAVLAAIMPHIKSASLLPISDDGCYNQMPESGITEEEYHKRVAEIKLIDWSTLRNVESAPELYCTGDVCERPQ